MGCAPGPRCFATAFGGVMSNLATWFTPSLQVLQRSKGRNAVAAAAYRACTLLKEEQLGSRHDYRSKTGHVSTELFGVPGLELGLGDIGTLWNKAERSETRKNSAVARELMVPLSQEWNDEQRRLCVRGLSEMLVARYGVAVMASIHRPADGQNDHVHILFTTREVDAQMNFGKKTRVLDDMKTGEVKKMREEICRIVNDHAKENGASWYVYAGKFADVIEGHIPTVHVPFNAGPELRASIEAENLAVLDARPLLARIAKESKEVEIQARILLAAAAETAQRDKANSNTAPRNILIHKSPSAPIPSPLSKDAQIRVSQLAVSLDLRQAYREVQDAHKKRARVREVAGKWKAHLKYLEDNPPGPLAVVVARLAAKLGVRVNGAVAVYEGKVAKAEETIGNLRKRNAKLTAFIEDPERTRKHQEWKQWPEHRKRVEEYETTLPDASKTIQQPAVSNWDGPYTLSQQPALTVPEPWG